MKFEWYGEAYAETKTGQVVGEVRQHDPQNQRLIWTAWIGSNCKNFISKEMAMRRVERYAETLTEKDLDEPEF